MEQDRKFLGSEGKVWYEKKTENVTTDGTIVPKRTQGSWQDET